MQIKLVFCGKIKNFISKLYLLKFYNWFMSNDFMADPALPKMVLFCIFIKRFEFFSKDKKVFDLFFEKLNL